MNHQLGRAESDGYSAAVIVLDTPGGLEESMRKIVQRELSLKIPVIVYVSPERRARGVGRRLDLRGRRRARDGAGDEHRLVDADQRQRHEHRQRPAAQGGQRRGRLAARAREDATAATPRGPTLAVRKASNLTAQEALQMNVIDLISPSLPALLNTIDGRMTVPRNFTLHTAGATDRRTCSPGFFTRFLSTLIDPNIVGLLFLAGIAGLGFELFHPGVVIPGAFGAICMVCALFGFSVLPLSWAGLMLVLLGAALLVDRRARRHRTAR